LHTSPENYFDNSSVATYTRSFQGGPGGVAFGIVGAWLAPGQGPQLNQIRVPTSHFDVGVHDRLPVVSVGGNNQWAVGPFTPPMGTNSGRATIFESSETLPPIRLKPGQRLVAQPFARFSSSTANNLAVFASFWWVERPWREPLPEG